MERQKGTTVAGKKGKDPNALLWLSKRRKTLLRRTGKKKAPKMPIRRKEEENSPKPQRCPQKETAGSSSILL